MSDSPPSEIPDNDSNKESPAAAIPAVESPNPAAPATAEPAAVESESPPAVVLDSVTCPQCEAELKNVRLEPGATLRCLNCGKRFRPAIPGDPTSVLVDGAGVKPSEAREPGSVGYWLLRIPAILLFAVATVSAALILNFNFRYMNGRLTNMAPFSYIPLMPWAGLFLFLVSRAFARIDSSAIRITWRNGALKSPLLSVPGSSLPYVAPISVAGGVLPVICVLANPDEVEAALIGTLFGAALFYAGFAIEDLRQFIWRQESLAKACCRNAGVDTESMKNGGGIPWSAIFISAAVVFLGAAIVCLSLMQLRWRTTWREILIPLYSGIALITVSYSLYRISRDWERAICWWQLARWAQRTKAEGGDAGQTAANYSLNWETGVWPPRVLRPNNIRSPIQSIYRYLSWNFDRNEADISTGERFVCLVPWFWLALGSVWLFNMFTNHNRFDDWDFAAFISLCLFGGALAVWFSVFLPQLARWRGAQASVWKALGVSGASTLPGWVSAAIVGVLFLAAVEAMLMGSLLFDELIRWNPNFERLIAFPLIMLIIHYPIVWLAMMLQLLMKAESACAEEKKLE